VANLINFGIVPMTLANPDDYENFAEGDSLEIKDFAAAVKGATEATLINKTNGAQAKLCLNLTERQREMLLAGGCLNYTKNQR
jgi:aconitate hydratase